MATQSSFKQQCPSCEAMVPIRDPKLIGRKIDCPKCKYRFVVEEPVDEVEELDEEAPGNKGKAAGITNKKPAKGPPGQRRADDDEDLDEGKPKKKQGGSGMLIAGIVMAAVAVIALGAGAVFLLTGDSDDEPKTASRPSTTTAPPTAEEPKKEKEAPKNDGPKPLHDDITNLLPNNTQVVVNLPLEHLFGNAKVNQAFLKTPGAFHEDAFKNAWGVNPSDIRRVVLSYNVEKKTVFSVMRSAVAMQEDKVVAGQKLKPQKPINGLKFYLVTKPMGPLSTLLLKGGAHHDTLALHFQDPFTVVCADMGPMNQFLQEKGQPKLLSSQPVDPEQGDGTAQGGPQDGGPQGSGPQSMQDMYRRMQGGGGRPAGGPPAGMQGGSPAAGGSGKPPMSMTGGYQPPSGVGSGMAPSSMTGGSTSEGSAPVSTSYLTIDKHLKSVLDQAERVDKNEHQNVLLSIGLLTAGSFVNDVKKGISQQGDSLQQGANSFLGLLTVLQNFKVDPKALAVAVTDFSESKASVNAAASAKDAETAQSWEKWLNSNISSFLEARGVDLVAKTPNPNDNAAANNPQGPQGGMGMMGGGMGMQGGNPQMQMQRQMQQQMQMRRQMQGGGGMMGGGNMPPRPPGPNGAGGAAAGGNQPQTDGEKPEEKGKLGTYEIWGRDTAVAGGVNLTLTSTQYKGISEGLSGLGIYVRSLMVMTEHSSHIHQLAAAMQAYLAKNGNYPRGTLSRHNSERFLERRPDQRLSWMREILPYLANGDYNDLQFEDKAAWYEDAKNMKAGVTVIPHFVAPYKLPDNPIYFYVKYPNLPVKGPDMWAATSFVGVAGVGLDAADYVAGDPATDKKRGVFGYDRETKKADIKDGLDQTIVLLQVPPEPKSPWIAGGGSTVRGVSEDLDCVQPFVCTEYEGKRGTFAIMGDGKVRFIPATIDPKVFQALCTIAGGDRVKNLDRIAPEVPPPEESAEQPELKTTEPAAPLVPPAVQATEPAVPAGWMRYTSAKGGFAVNLPSAGKVLQQETQLNLPVGGKLTVNMYGKEIAGTGAFVTSYSDYPNAVMAEGADKILDNVKTGIAGSSRGAKITGESRITVEGHPGRELDVDIPGKGTMKARVFLVKNRLFQLIVGSDGGKLPAKDMQIFFDSFKLTGK